MNCPPVARWIALAAGAVSGEEREALMLHAEDCLDCRDEWIAALAAGAAQEESPTALPPALRARVIAGIPKRRAWIPRAAAASFLLAIGVLAVTRHVHHAAPRIPSQPPGIAPPAATDPFRTRAGDLVTGIGRASTLAVRHGSRISVGNPATGRIAFESGAMALDARGDPVTVAWQDCTVLATSAEFVLEDVPSPAFLSFLMREACAAEGRARLTVLRGGVTVRKGQAHLEIPEGRSVDLATLDILPQGVTWTVGWVKLPWMGTVRDARRDLGPGTLPEAYLWEAILIRKVGAAVMEVRFPAGGRGWSLPLGADLAGEPGARVRIALESVDGWIRLEVRGNEILRCPASALNGRVQPGDATTPGLRAWGGDVLVEEVRWKELSP